MTLDDGTNELDLLFGEVERSPFAEKDTNAVSSESTADTMEATIAANEMAEAIATGGDFPNGAFGSGPPDDSLSIDEDNDLPEWEITHAQGTGCAVTWGADATAPLGYALTFTMTDGRASDETYFEQTVPVANAFRWFITTVEHLTTDTNLQVKVAVQFLDETGSDVGSEKTATWSSLSKQVDRLFRTPPSSLAVDARIRFGVISTADFSGAQVVTILYISGLHPQVYSVNISGTFSVASPGTSTVYQMYYPTDVITSVAGAYRTDLDGFVLGISAKTSDTITAGTGTVRVKDATKSTNPGPTVALSSGTTEADSTLDIDGASSYHFASGDRLHLELSTDGSFASSGSADYVGSARLLLVIHDSNDW